MHGDAAAHGTELRGTLTWAAGPPRTPAVPSEATRPRPDQALEIMLAEEMLAVWGARLIEVRERFSDLQPI